MKLLSLIIYKWKDDSSVEVLACEELSSFSYFHRKMIKEHIKFHSRLIVSRTPLGRRSSVEFEQSLGMCHSWVHPQGIGAAVLIDSEYPMRVAFTLLYESVRSFLETNQGRWKDLQNDTVLPCPEIEQLFLKFQEPTEADTLTKIERDLEEVKGTVMQSIDDLLKRGESLDQLMDKSRDLADVSVRFYNVAKKNNQCCKLY